MKRNIDFERYYLDAKLPSRIHRKLEPKKAVTIFDLMVINSFLLSLSIYRIKIFIQGGSAGGYEYGSQHGQHGGQQQAYVEVTVEPTEATVGQGEKVTLKCNVKGAENYQVTWVKYAHDTSLPNYIRVSIELKIDNEMIILC